MSTAKRIIRNIADLKQLAVERKSVHVPGWSKPKAAAWVLNMSAVHVDGLIARGLEVYEPKRASKSTAGRSLDIAVVALRAIAGAKSSKAGAFARLEWAALHAKNALRLIDEEVGLS